MKCMEKAYAKVNLTLQVGSRRPDGYHAVMSVMQRISLWDTVTVERGTGRDTLLCSVPVTENVDDNLCMKAARAFFAETGTKSDGVTITLEKHIPVQAGLRRQQRRGGGAAGAADTVRAGYKRRQVGNAGGKAGQRCAVFYPGRYAVGYGQGGGRFAVAAASRGLVRGGEAR